MTKQETDQKLSEFEKSQNDLMQKMVTELYAATGFAKLLVAVLRDPDVLADQDAKWVSSRLIECYEAFHDANVAHVDGIGELVEMVIAEGELPPGDLAIAQELTGDRFGVKANSEQALDEIIKVVQHLLELDPYGTSFSATTAALVSHERWMQTRTKYFSDFVIGLTPLIRNVQRYTS